jgi:DNA repair ATPase RecN
MPEEKRLIAELTVCDQDRRATQFALSNPQHRVLMDEYQQLTKAAELARGKVDAVRVRLASLRTAKLRNKDSHDLHKLQNALNSLAEEIDAITYAAEVGKEQTPSPEANVAYHERYRRLAIIREKLADLTLVMDSVGGKPRSPSRAKANSDIGGAMQKLQSAESNLEDVEAHLNNAARAQTGDQTEIASAKSSVNDVDEDLKAAKAALEKSVP